MSNPMLFEFQKEFKIEPSTRANHFRALANWIIRLRINPFECRVICKQNNLYYIVTLPCLEFSDDLALEI